MSRPCPICNNAVELQHLWGLESVVHCPRCTLGYVETLPTVAELSRTYSLGYFVGGELDYDDYEAERTALEANFRRRIGVLRRYQDGGQLFEIGCAYGFFLKLAGGHWRAAGIDISNEAVAYAHTVLGAEAYAGDFESYPLPHASQDVIVLWDTIEHLYDPVLTVHYCANALRPGGLLALTTGDVGALLPRLRRTHWRLIHPQHLYYFSRQSISALLARYDLDMLYFAHEPVCRSLREMLKALRWRNSTTGWQRALHDHLNQLRLLRVVVPLNLYDIMFVIARKC